MPGAGRPHALRRPAAAATFGDRPARLAERVLRSCGDPRLGVGLLLLTGAANAIAAAVPQGPVSLESPAYVLLLGGVLLSGLAAVAVRLPAVWREWRRPTPVAAGPGALTAELGIDRFDAPLDAARVEEALRTAGYRVSAVAGPGRWAVHGTRRGWSRLAALASHVALLLVIVGAAVGAAFGSETTFSLLPGGQALLGGSRPGFTDAVRLERFDAAFGPDGRPSRLDTHVTFLRDGEPIRSQTLRVNEPGDFGGTTVHGWTYGPAARVRVTSLAGRPLHDEDVALAELRDGRPFAFVELPTAGVTLGVELADAQANVVAVTAATPTGVLDAARLTPGGEARLGDVVVALDGFSSYVTFLARRDPGGLLLVTGAALLTLSLAVAFWLPRRRITVRGAGETVRITLRGERFDRPAGELERTLAGLGHRRA